MLHISINGNNDREVSVLGDTCRRLLYQWVNVEIVEKGGTGEPVSCYSQRGVIIGTDLKGITLSWYEDKEVQEMNILYCQIVSVTYWGDSSHDHPIK
jgi:hypothetical protein